MCVTVTLLRCVVYVPITTHNHRRRKGSVVGGHYGECGARVIAGVWRQSPQRGPGAEPLVSGAKPPPDEAESILVIGCPTEPVYLPKTVSLCFVTVHWCQSWGGECMVPPTPSLGGGLCWPPAPPPMRIIFRTPLAILHRPVDFVPIHQIA